MVLAGRRMAALGQFGGARETDTGVLPLRFAQRQNDVLLGWGRSEVRAG